VKAIQKTALHLGNNYPPFVNTMVNYIGYYNLDDPRTFVEKIGAGTTVNFATKGRKWFFCFLFYLLFLLSFL